MVEIKEELVKKIALHQVLIERFGDSKERRSILAFYQEAYQDIDEWIVSLERLVKVAQNDTGQSHKIAMFLVSIYNSRFVKLCPRELHGVDQTLWLDCMNVLKLDHINIIEIHEYMDNGNNIFANLIHTWGFCD